MHNIQLLLRNETILGESQKMADYGWFLEIIIS